MAPLLADPRTYEFDIIALQEPWINPHQRTTYCPSAAPFHLVFPPEKGRCCFLINKKLDTAAWEPSFPSPDLCTLRLETRGHKLWIHNVYSPPPGSYSNTSYETPIPGLAGQLEQDGEHIVLGDFNLHHPLWCGPRNPATHKAADTLVDTLQQYDLSLTLPHGTVTWEARGAASTIDLVFTSLGLQNRVLECQVRQDLEHGSDHFPIATEVALSPAKAPMQRRRN
jgi:exonuclease III